MSARYMDIYIYIYILEMSVGCLLDIVVISFGAGYQAADVQ